MDITSERLPIWDRAVQPWCLPHVQHSWLWVCCVSPFCSHARAVPIAPWRVRWGEDDTLAAMRRQFRCGVCGQKGCVFLNPKTDIHGVAPFPAGRELVMSGARQTGESYAARDARVMAEYLARFPSGDALGEFRGGPPGPASMCGKFTAMASWAEVVAFTQPLTTAKATGANDEPVTLRVTGLLNVIVWDAQEQRRKVAKMRWGFPHPKNWRVPQPIHARSETMDELKTFKRPFLTGQRGIVLMRTFNEGKQVAPSKTEQWTIDPVPEHMMGAAFIFDSFTTPELDASFLACVLVTVPANALIQTLSTEHAAADRMPAFLDPAHWAIWLGENINDPVAAKAACTTREGVRWTMTKEERAATKKRSKPTVADPGGLL
jgi:putative SOS response-associated peptidase YedK